MANFFLEIRNFFLNCLKNRNFLEICLEKLKFFVKLLEKNRNFSKICLESQRFLVKLPEKIEIFRKFAWKNRFFLAGSTTLQISNQINAELVPETPNQEESRAIPALS